MSLITCKNLKIGYDNHTVAKNLTFNVNSGDYLCIIGENGTGKSTLINTLLGLRNSIEGEILFGDGLKPTEIGYLPQQTMVQKDFPASVWEIVLSGCLNSSGLFPFYTKAQKKLANENIERMGITHLKNRCYRELSGGQQQRVLLARALCATKKLLLLDEPVSGLDVKVTAEMYDLIKKLNDEGITIIMVSHDLNAVVEYSTNILQLGCNPCFFGSKEQYVSSEVGKTFIGKMGGAN